MWGRYNLTSLMDGELTPSNGTIWIHPWGKIHGPNPSANPTTIYNGLCWNSSLFTSPYLKPKPWEQNHSFPKTQRPTRWSSWVKCFLFLWIKTQNLFSLDIQTPIEEVWMNLQTSPEVKAFRGSKHLQLTRYDWRIFGMSIGFGQLRQLVRIPVHQQWSVMVT